jgi:hypothetical protein
MTPMTVNEWQCCMPLAFLAALNWCNANTYLPFVLFFFLLRTGATRDVSIKTQCVNNEWWSPCAHFSGSQHSHRWGVSKVKLYRIVIGQCEEHLAFWSILGFIGRGIKSKIAQRTKLELH